LVSEPQYEEIYILEIVRLEVFTMTTTNKILSVGHINLKQKPECFRDPLKLYQYINMEQSHHSGIMNKKCIYK